MAKVGRPSKYDPKVCKRVLELGRQGYSVVEMACDIGVSRNTLETQWPAAFPEFLEAFTRAREESQAWWEKAGREGLKADRFNAAVWSRSMSARFPKDWRETTRQEHTGADGGPIEVDQVNSDADAFTRSVARLASRREAPEGAGETQH
jgi:hypothetical protein